MDRGSPLTVDNAVVPTHPAVWTQAEHGLASQLQVARSSKFIKTVERSVGSRSTSSRPWLA